MSECRWTEKVEAFHDGEAAHAAGVEAHLQECGGCREYLALLGTIRGGVMAARPEVEIADAQFRVFMDGIREGIEAKPRGWAVFWSRLSIVAAGFVLVVALSYIVTAGPVRTWADQILNPNQEEVHLLHPPGGGIDVDRSETRKDLE